MCQIETVRAQSSRPQLSQPERCSQHWDPPNKPSRRPPRAIRQALELKQRPREKSPAFGRLWRRLLGAVETPLLQGLTPPAPCPSPALTVTSPGHTTSGLPYPQPEPHTAARERSKTATRPCCPHASKRPPVREKSIIPRVAERPSPPGPPFTPPRASPFFQPCTWTTGNFQCSIFNYFHTFQDTA